MHSLPLLLVRKTPRDECNHLENSFVCMLIIVTTKKELYMFTAAILVNAIIYLWFFRKGVEKTWTDTHTCHYGCHGMLRYNCAEIIRKKPHKWLLSTSWSIIELLRFFLSSLLNTRIIYLCKPFSFIVSHTYALPSLSPCYMSHPLTQLFITCITYVLPTPWHKFQPLRSLSL